MSRLAGKTALVTGAGRGLGREIARRLAEDGAALVAHYGASRDGAEALSAELGVPVLPVQADIAKRAEVVRMFEEIDMWGKGLDIVVNSAAISAGGPLADLDEEAFERMLAINLKGPLYVASEASKRLGDGGRIINIGSTMSEFPMGGTGIYSATKAALKSMTESWAKELGKRGITVNMVIPGATSPGMAERSTDYYRQFYEKASPFGRIGEAREVAAVVAFLASPEASWVSAAHILANGAANA